MRGLTLVELLVTLAIFVAMALMMVTMVRTVTERWGESERRRILFERAAGALDRIGEDLELALGREVEGVTEVRAKLIGDLDPKTKQSRLFFVRSFEMGPERGLTFTAGDGRPSDLRFRPPPDPTKPAPPVPPPAGPVDGDSFTGKRVGDYRALGGMAMVAYFTDNQTLYRSIRSPVEGPFQELLKEDYRTPLIEDCLYLQFDYWSAFSSTWEEQPPRSRTRGPESIWDSTRGITAPPLGSSFFHVGPQSLNDPADDVFPVLVRVTLTADSPMPRCTFTKLTEDLREGAVEVHVDSTKGFPAGGTEDSYILIENEWVYYRQKKDDYFVVERRGARRTVDRDHPAGSVVRIGRTFRRTVFLPCYREE